ncbi:unnamed protein product [Thelazia callipaeda]|uniref:Mitotic spindle assembly checkpoint protein MAD2A n=1 Tax=Thelazia callipaeda TaxID=103827 RepID=A0A0N5CKY4_THECL|nr:unnamed protein product [Thelazia callipaeda]
MATETKIRDVICLKGSAQIVQEFFHFGLNSILYQRGIYPAESFAKEKKYGLTMLVTTNPALQKFLTPLLDRVKYWLENKQLRKLVLVISDIQTKNILERWQFDIQTDETVDLTGENSVKYKDIKKIRQEIADVIRQITATVTFLPLLETQCSFDVLTYTGKETDTPEDWTECSACLISDAEEVQLRSFSTAVHSVHTKVSYKSIS